MLPVPTQGPAGGNPHKTDLSQMVYHNFAELGWHLRNITGPWTSHQYMNHIMIDGV